MKRSIALIAFVGMVCLLVAGCAVFRSHKEEKAGKGGTPTAGANLSSGGTEQGANTNQSTVIITSSGPITTTTEGGKVTTIAGGGEGGAGAGLEGQDIGAGSSKPGHGPLFYFYILFAAAIVLWIIWALWHSYHRNRPPVRYRRRVRRTV